MNNEQKSNIIKLVLSYSISFLKITSITPLILLIISPLFIILILIQDNISAEISSKILYVIFLVKESVNESNLLGYYLIYVSISSVFLEIINKIYKKRFYFKLKYKIITLISYFFITYTLIGILFFLFEGMDLFVVALLFLFSLIYCIVSISINHGLNVLIKKINNSNIINQSLL